MRNKEIIIWHEMDGVGDSSLKYIESICHHMELQENIKCKLVKMSIKEFMKRLNHLEQETEKPDVILIAQDMITLKGLDLSEVPDKFRHYMNDTTWDSMKYKGIQRGVPYLQGNHAVMFYNKRFFPQPPKTWDDIIALKREQICSFSMDLDVSYWLMPFIYSIYGNPILNGKVTITKKNTIEVQKFILSLIHQGTLCSYCAVSTMLDKFLKGRIASMINGEWLYKYLKDNMGDSVAVCELPRLATGEMAGISSMVGFAFPCNSLKGAKRIELEAFIDYMLSNEVQEKWFKDYQRIPVNQEVLNNINSIITDVNLKNSYAQMLKNYFLVNEECISDLWNTGEIILEEIRNNAKNGMNIGGCI